MSVWRIQAPNSLYFSPLHMYFHCEGPEVSVTLSTLPRKTQLFLKKRAYYDFHRAWALQPSRAPSSINIFLKFHFVTAFI